MEKRHQAKDLGPPHVVSFDSFTRTLATKVSTRNDGNSLLVIPGHATPL